MELRSRKRPVKGICTYLRFLVEQDVRVHFSGESCVKLVQGSCYVRLWRGESYYVMRGCRFYVELNAFV